MPEFLSPMSFSSMGHGSERPHQTIPCPQCGSLHIHDKNNGKRLGSALGICAGAIQSLSNMSKGACLGAAAGFHMATPVNPLNRITTAVLGAMVGATLGCAAGAALGQVIDQTLLNNHRCLCCGYSFQSL